MILSRTNYRISILGGGNDKPEFYSKYGSYIIGFGLNHHVYVMANFINKIDDICYQAFYSFSEKVRNVQEFKNPAIYGAMTFLEQKLGRLPCMSIHVNNTLPSSCGIASSSSLIVGILNAVYNLLGYSISKQELANSCNFIERHIINEPGGIQDPFWVSYAGIGSLSINKGGDVIYNKFNLSLDFIETLKDWSILFYYSQRQSFDIAKSYDGNAEKQKLKLLDIALQGKNAFEQENIIEIKNLLNENWHAKKSISNMISNSNIDELYNIVQNHKGSMKVCGVGGGGAIYCLCPPNHQKDLIAAVNLPIIPIDFDYDGTKIIYQQI